MQYTKKAELHCHSHHEGEKTIFCRFLYEATQPVEKLIDTAVEKGIKILAITDHDRINAIPKAQQYIADNNLDILLIPGSEISTKDGHILAYNIKTPIPAKLPAEETIKRIHEQGGIAVIAHPYHFVFGVKEKVRTLNADGIEGYNAGFFKRGNEKAQKVAKERNLPCTAGSDAHGTSIMGHGVMLFPEDTDTIEKFIRYLKENQFKIEFNKINSLKYAITHVLTSLQMSLGKKS